ncbi:response regulator [Thalassotalea piscium]|uniref:DNA-binding NarL/FixJ family response regulator n=1 Tax=Thalassotalea piscium TaxID=1230533 RepID=A0A7X0NDZ0_9GAMM|nr:response regulator transcription factor [Thalassotalea piscium]MBB6541613.1 DNA-binding NarL/FixJ family response regulator [Thalassotalea piscium]
MLVEDQKLIRDGIKSLLELSGQVTVVAEASDGKTALALIDKHELDIILMDIQMPVLNGIDTLRQMSINECDIPVLILTTFDDKALINEAISSGAYGYLLKDVSLEVLVTAIQQVVSGKKMIQPAITERLLQGLKNMPNLDNSDYNLLEKLTEKESEILRLIASGYNNREIAETMCKSEGTVKNQVSVILAKMGVKDRTRAVLRAIEYGLIG